MNVPARDGRARVLSGVIPVAPTPFDERDEVDYAGQKRILDFLVDAGVDAICVLANYSEQFGLTDVIDLAGDALPGQCGLRAAKVLLREGGIIACERARPPTPPLHPATRAALLELSRKLDPLILRWAR
jgi:dihydrodipicolinate synthase/N-acetylneuraminate lyase